MVPWPGRPGIATSHAWFVNDLGKHWLRDVAATGNESPEAAAAFRAARTSDTVTRAPHAEPTITSVAAAPTPLEPPTAPVADRRAPVILVATANEAEGARHLRSLALELQDIVAALDEAQRGGVCEIVTLPDATPEQVLRVFQSEAYRNRIAILHFAGHAGPEGLLFETSDGSTAVADAGGLAAFLGCQRGLQLVVLNACATQAHVDSLRDAGVGAVVATSKSVEDAIAHQFAVLLYQGLGSGAGIKRAYDEAAAGVRFKHGAIARGSTAESMHASAAAVSNDAPAAAATTGAPVASRPEPAEATSRDIVRKNGITTDDGRWPWDLYFRRGAEEIVAPWALPEAAGNPLFGLPTLPETDKPLTEPFRHLRPFSRQHAELFFGRGKDIRELYDKVTSTASEPVILLYGATGVGKSSLLDAGLLPRLTGTYDAQFAPRDRTLKLLGTLLHSLGGDTSGEIDATRVAEAWRAREAAVGRPVFGGIAQIEEAYTTEDTGRVAAGEAGRELDAFASALGSLFASETTRPRGRLVLGFRKEWLSEVKAALETHRVPKTEHRLEQLNRNGVLEAITGPTRLPVRRMPTRLEIEPGLDVLIADDLLANRASQVAPLLQILLATMWADAARDGGVVRFTASLYEAVQRKSKQLDEFLTKQLDALRDWNASTVDSGLALEFLRFYTTPKGTSDEHTAEEEKKRYPNADATSPGLRAMCARLYLLVERLDDAGEPPPERPARLAHDTLASIVRERFDRSDLPGPRAKRILDGRSAEWRDGKVGTPLDAADLKLVEEGESGMRVWNDEERALVAASRVERDRARRRRAWVIRGAIAAVTLIAAFGVGSWLLYQQSRQRLADSTSRELGGRALNTETARRDVALLYAAAAYEQAPTFESRRALLSQVGRDPTLMRVLSTTANDLVLSADGTRAYVAELDGIHAVDIATGVEAPPVAVPAGHDPAKLVLDPTGTTFSAMPASDSTQPVAIIGVWALPTGRPLGSLRVDAPNGSDRVSWTVGPAMTDGRHLVVVNDGSELALWDLERGTRVRALGVRGAMPNLAYFSGDGSLIVTTGDDGRVIAWDAATGKAVRTVRVRPDRSPSIAISHDNSAVAVAADDTVSVWWLRDPRPPRRLAGQDYAKVVFTGDDSALVVNARGGELHVFDRPLDSSSVLIGGVPSRSLVSPGDLPDALSASAVGRRVATLSNGTVHVWDLTDTSFISVARLPLEPGTDVVAGTPDGKFVAAKLGDVFTIWDVERRRPVGRAVALTYPDSVRAFADARAALADGGRLLAAPALEMEGRGPRDLYRTADGTRRGTVAPPSGSAAAFAALGTRVAWGIPGSRAVVVTDLAKPGVADTLDPGVDRRTKIDSGWAPSAELNSRGNLLVVQPTQFSLLVWDVGTRQVRDSLTAISLYSSNLFLSDDGSTIGATVGYDGEAITFWRHGSREPLTTLRVPGIGSMRVAALSSNGALFAVYTTRRITLADVARGEVLGEIDLGPGSAGAIAFIDGDRTLLAVSAGGRIMRIPIDPEVWVGRACRIAASTESFQRFSVDAPGGMAPPARCTRRPSGRSSR